MRTKCGREWCIRYWSAFKKGYTIQTLLSSYKLEFILFVYWITHANILCIYVSVYNQIVASFDFLLRENILFLIRLLWLKGKLDQCLLPEFDQRVTRAFLYRYNALARQALFILIPNHLFQLSAHRNTINYNFPMAILTRLINYKLPKIHKQFQSKWTHSYGNYCKLYVFPTSNKTTRVNNFSA